MNYAYIKRAANYPSVINLNPSLTINGTAVTPTFRYKLGDANATNLVPWGYGATLSRVAVATPPTYNAGSPGLGANDDSCKFNDSDYYKNATAVNQITTGDIAIELIFKFYDESSYLVSTYDASTGYIVRFSSNKLILSIVDSGGSAEVDSAATLVDGVWYHAMIFVNRDEDSNNGSRIYINGVLSGAGDDLSARSGTLAAAQGFSLGARYDGTVSCNTTIAYLAAWESASWFQAGAAGPAEWATIAAARFASLKAGWDWASLT